MAAALKDDPDIMVAGATLLLGGDFMSLLSLPPDEYEIAVAALNKALDLHQIQQRNQAQSIAAALAPYLR